MASPTDLIKTQIQMEGRRRLLGYEARVEGAADALRFSRLFSWLVISENFDALRFSRLFSWSVIGEHFYALRFSRLFSWSVIGEHFDVLRFSPRWLVWFGGWLTFFDLRKIVAQGGILGLWRGCWPNVQVGQNYFCCSFQQNWPLLAPPGDPSIPIPLVASVFDVFSSCNCRELPWWILVTSQHTTGDQPQQRKKILNFEMQDTWQIFVGNTIKLN